METSLQLSLWSLGVEIELSRLLLFELDISFFNMKYKTYY